MGGCGHDRSLLLRGIALRNAATWLAAGTGAEPRPTSLQARFIASGGRDAATRQRRAGIAAGVVTVVLTAIAVFALIQRAHAIDDAKTARSRALAADSVAQLSVDPELSLLLALRALGERGIQPAGVALRRVVGASHVRARMVGHQHVEFSPRGDVLLTADHKTARLWDVTSGDSLLVQPSTEAAGFTPDGEHFYTTQSSLEGPRHLTIWRCDMCGPIDDVRTTAQARVTRALTAAE